MYHIIQEDEMKGFIKQFLVVSVILIMVGCRMSASNT